MSIHVLEDCITNQPLQARLEEVRLRYYQVLSSEMQADMFKSIWWALRRVKYRKTTKAGTSVEDT